jgi:Spy/CpxP family protein refolding chaperone
MAPQPSPDQPLTKAQRDALRASMVGQRDERMEREAIIVASLAGGMSLRQVAAQVKLSHSQVDRIWKAHQEHAWETPDQVRAELHLRLSTMLRAIWPQVVAGDVAAVREARMITAEQAALEGVYKGKLEVDVSGSIDHTHRQERTSNIFGMVARVRAGQLIEAEALPAAATNGHDPSPNGSEAA